MRILVVEDSVTMRKVMQMTFAGEGAELLAVSNGEEALAQGRSFSPDVAFVDASLPGQDGYELTRAIKADPQLAGTAVILMASQHRPLDEGRASEVGADEHILKPFDTQEAIDKAAALAGGVQALSDAPSIPVVRAAPQPTPLATPAYRPTPPPLPVSGRAVQPSNPVSSTPLSGASVSAIPAAASSLPAERVPTLKSQPAMPAPSPTAVTSEVVSHSVVARLEALGLTAEQVQGVLNLSAEVVERVVWEVVPELAEAMIREELHRLVGD
ncbi:MAG: response regulator [Myxococcota bacterium]